MNAAAAYDMFLQIDAYTMVSLHPEVAISPVKFAR